MSRLNEKLVARQGSELPKPAPREWHSYHDTPGGSALEDFTYVTEAQNRDIDRGVGPVSGLIRHTARLLAANQRDERRQEAARRGEWSNSLVLKQQKKFLDQVAHRLLGHEQWDENAERELRSVAPGLGDALDSYLKSIQETQSELWHFSRKSADAAAADALACAQTLADAIAGNFRAVPSAPTLPWVGWRYTFAQRRRAVAGAAESVADLSRRWFEFTYLDDAPEDCGDRLVQLGLCYDAGGVTERLLVQVNRLSKLADQESISRAEIRAVFADLSAATKEWTQVLSKRI